MLVTSDLSAACALPHGTRLPATAVSTSAQATVVPGEGQRAALMSARVMTQRHEIRRSAFTFGSSLERRRPYFLILWRGINTQQHFAPIIFLCVHC